MPPENRGNWYKSVQFRQILELHFVLEKK